MSYYSMKTAFTVWIGQNCRRIGLENTSTFSEDTSMQSVHPSKRGIGVRKSVWLYPPWKKSIFFVPDWLWNAQIGLKTN